MTSKNSKTLLYLQALGCEPYSILSTGEHGELKHWASMLSDYELTYYHCKVLKMPISTYNKGSIVDYITYMAIYEYCQELDQQKQEAREERAKAKERAELKARVYKAIVIYWGLLCLVAVLICFYMWLCWR